MGYLEDLDRIARERRDAADKQRLKDEEDKKAQIRQQEKAKEEREQRIREATIRAMNHFQQSGLGDLIVNLVKAKKDIETPKFDDSEGFYTCRIDIERHFVDGSTEETHAIKIETDSYGTIKFKGNIFGNSTVAQSVWQQDRSKLEKALGKAYRHPMFEIISHGRGEATGPDGS